LIQIVVSLS